MDDIYLIEDHDEALKIWREKKRKAIDLIHVDAHIDFGFYHAKPIEKIVKEAKNQNEIRRRLVYTLTYLRYEKDIDNQIHTENYVYPAMEEGLIKNFYWIVPGGTKEFKESYKSIKEVLKSLTNERVQKKGDIISTRLLGRNLVVCTLDSLPDFRQNVLLDIDIDFLVIDSVLDADKTTKIGKRKPWISPSDLVSVLKKKIKNPQTITIAYSVNGGWTPLKYKHLGDEIAYCFAPGKFKSRFDKNSRAAEFFAFFTTTGKKEHYQNAVRLNATYRAADNNYGPLYLSLRKFSLAHDEFMKILKVDPRNPSCLYGLGWIALERKDFKKAKRCFSSVLNSKDNGLFKKVRERSLLGLAKVEYCLKNIGRAKELLFQYKDLEPLRPQTYYLLGRIFEKEKDFERSAGYYVDAHKLRLEDIEVLWRLLHILRYLKDKKVFIAFVATEYERMRKEFVARKKINLNQGKKIQSENKIEKRLEEIKKKLQSYH